MALLTLSDEEQDDLLAYAAQQFPQVAGLVQRIRLRENAVQIDLKKAGVRVEIQPQVDGNG